MKECSTNLLANLFLSFLSFLFFAFFSLLLFALSEANESDPDKMPLITPQALTSSFSFFIFSRNSRSLMTLRKWVEISRLASVIIAQDQLESSPFSDFLHSLVRSGLVLE